MSDLMNGVRRSMSELEAKIEQLGAEIEHLQAWKRVVTNALADADPRCMDLDDEDDAAKLIRGHYEDARATIDARDAEMDA